MDSLYERALRMRKEAALRRGDVDAAYEADYALRVNQNSIAAAQGLKVQPISPTMTRLEIEREAALYRGDADAAIEADSRIALLKEKK